MSFLRVTCDAVRGLQCRKRPAKDGWGENRLATYSFKTTMTRVIIFLAAFPVLKRKRVEENTGFIGFPSVYLVPTSVMVVIANFRTRWWLGFAGIGTGRVVKCRIFLGRTKSPEQKGVNLEGLGGWTRDSWEIWFREIRHDVTLTNTTWHRQIRQIRWQIRDTREIWFREIRRDLTLTNTTWHWQIRWQIHDTRDTYCRYTGSFGGNVGSFAEISGFSGNMGSIPQTTQQFVNGHLYTKSRIAVEWAELRNTCATTIRSVAPHVSVMLRRIA